MFPCIYHPRITYVSLGDPPEISIAVPKMQIVPETHKVVLQGHYNHTVRQRTLFKVCSQHPPVVESCSY